MNIFYLDPNPITAAQMHCDQHVHKMLLETAQMLSTAHRVLDGQLTKRLSVSGKTMVKYWVHPDEYKEQTLYKVAHLKHPSNIWIRESVEHYGWAKDLLNALSDEYTHRHGKVHATSIKVAPLLQLPPKAMKMNGGWTPPPQCMDDYLKQSNTVLAYRDFYIKEKSKFARWKKTRKSPNWYLTPSTQNTTLHM